MWADHALPRLRLIGAWGPTSRSGPTDSWGSASRRSPSSSASRCSGPGTRGRDVRAGRGRRRPHQRGRRVRRGRRGPHRPIAGRRGRGHRQERLAAHIWATGETRPGPTRSGPGWRSVAGDSPSARSGTAGRSAPCSATSTGSPSRRRAPTTRGEAGAGAGEAAVRTTRRSSSLPGGFGERAGADGRPGGPRARTGRRHRRDGRCRDAREPSIARTAAPSSAGSHGRTRAALIAAGVLFTVLRDATGATPRISGGRSRSGR